ncbi:cellobiose dehydrogenase, partial [Rhizoctonia solani]
MNKLFLYTIDFLVLCGLSFASALHKQNEASFDYIVVGSGPAGIVVADRLSEAGKKVLLIERGGPSIAATGGTDTPPWPYPTNLTRFDIPGAFESFYDITAGIPYFWCRDLPALGGCIIGGGAAINSMLYWYPQDEDFATSNNWPVGFQNIAPYVSKLHNRLPSTDVPSPDGKRYLTQVYDVFKGVLDAQGYQSITINNQRNKKDKIYGYSAFSSQRGTRTGPMGTYLQTALARPNFKLLAYTKALAVARNGSTITGVHTNNTEVGNNGLIYVNPKGGRVILSAGSFGSARLLFQSGIGPADSLANVEATPESAPYLPPRSTYLDLPVGYNLQDNPSVSLVFSHPSVNAYQNFRPVWFNPNLTDAKQYVESQSGVLAQTSPRINWWKKYVGSDSKVRWMQGTASPGNPASCCNPGPGVNNETLIWVTLYLGRGIASSGRASINNQTRVTLTTTPWLTDPIDREVLITATKDVISTYQKGRARFLIDLSIEFLSRTRSAGFGVALPELEQYYHRGSCQVSTTVGGSNHWIGSTRTGTNSSTSVVDANLKVWGTDNLFVVDAGVFPGMPVGNPTASIMVMAEMAAAKLLKVINEAKNDTISIGCVIPPISIPTVTMSEQLLKTASTHNASLVGMIDSAFGRVMDVVASVGWTPLARLAESGVVALMQKITVGHLRVLTESHIYNFPPHGSEGIQDGPSAELRVVKDSFWIRLVTMSDLGFAEAFMYGDVECDDLVTLFKIFLLNRENLVEMKSAIASLLFTLPQRLTSIRFLNTLSNSRSNISAHYDISNQMFEAFLSRDMTYSCAIFPTLDADMTIVEKGERLLENGVVVKGLGNGDFHGIGVDTDVPANKLTLSDEEDELYQAQMIKLEHLVKKLKIPETSDKAIRILEIGSGWGALAILLTQKYPFVEVDSLTLSSEQKSLAEERIHAAGVESRVRIWLMDYRCVPESWTGIFDRFVSIEMIEAVGREFLKEYWAIVERCMKPENSVGVVQVITIPEPRVGVQDTNGIFARLISFGNGIPGEVFPGGHLPTVTALVDTLAQGGKNKLIIDSISNIGPHYARTLREWRRRFLARFDSDIIPSLKREYPDVFDESPRGRQEIEVFKRKWVYYYCYCEVGFTTRTLGDHIITFVREGFEGYGCDSLLRPLFSHPTLYFQSSAMKGFFAVAALTVLSALGGASASSNYHEKRVDHFGQLTWFNPVSGNDGCGYQVPSGVPAVHVSPTYWRNGENCGQWVQLNINGKQSYGVVTGECKTCPPEGIDTSPILFNDFAHQDVGLLSCKWKFMKKGWEPKELAECE